MRCLSYISKSDTFPSLINIDKPSIEDLKKGEILVKVKSASLNPADYKAIAGGNSLVKLEMPITVGFDFSGIVIKGGNRFQTGDRVFGMINGLPQKYRGTVAEYVIVREDVCVKCPEGKSHEECASIPLVAITVIKAFEKCGLKKGDKVLILGGSGGVGTIAIQIAKNIFNASHIVTTASSGKKMNKCYELGADNVIDYRKYDFDKVIYDKFNVILDCTGEARRATKLLESEGSICSLVSYPTLESIKEWMVEQNITSKQIGYCMFKIINSYIGMKLINIITGACFMKKYCKGNFYHVIGGGNGKIMEKVSEYLRDEKIKPVIDKVFTIDEAESAFNYLMCSKTLGKIIINL